MADEFHDAPDDDDRLWAVLSPESPEIVVEVPPPPPPAKPWCRRCGHGRDRPWRAWVSHPRCCPNCHSAYWDTPAVMEHGRRPSGNGTDRIRPRTPARTMAYHLEKARIAAKEMGMVIVDVKTTHATSNGPAPVPRRTVPPPPGMEDVK